MNVRINIYFIFCFALLLFCIACTEEVPTKENAPIVTKPLQQKSKPILTPTQNKPEIEGKLVNPNKIISKEKIKTTIVNCKTDNKTLPENVVGLPVVGVTAFIGANETTKDSDLGDSHRIFEVKTAANCDVLFSETLPVNVSPDFPYYLSKDACNEQLGLIGVRGFQSAAVFEVHTKKLYKNLKPQFAKSREAADPTSGMISNLIFDQNYLYGYAVDYGVFAFDMKKNGSPVLPISEFSDTQIFGFLRSMNQVDLIIPIVTFDENGVLDLQMKNVFERTIRINPALKFKFQNGRYIIFKEKRGASPTNHLVVDMKKKERLDLPKEIATGTMKQVMNYLQ